MIPRDQCKHGYTYRIHSRNLWVGVFNSADGGFVGIREKFGHLYLFPEYHRDNGPPYGTVSPEVELEKCPIEDLRDHLDTVCGKCGKRAEWKKENPDGTGTWYHLEKTDCEKAHPGAPQNQPLFDYLNQLEKKIENEPWRDCYGKLWPIDKLTVEERNLLKLAVWKAQDMEWTPFANWWGQEFDKGGFDPRLDDPTGKNPLWAILQDIEGRLGVEQGKCARPENYTPYRPLWPL